MNGRYTKRQILPRLASRQDEARFSNHVGKRLLIREALNRLDEVLIGISVCCNDVTEVGDDGKGIGLVCSAFELSKGQALN